MAVLISAHELKKSFAARPLFQGLTFAIESGDRIGLIGPNGAGKSTLLKILASQISQDEGTLSLSRGLKVGYLEQTPSFSPDATLLSSVLEGGDHDPSMEWESHLRAQELISRFQLDAFDETTPVESLSGGWKKRVALARELMKEPELLLLDEPTNHLDVESIVWLEELITKASFATVTITHDRLFLQNISNRIIELDSRHSGGLLNIQGDYAQYLEIREQLIQAQERREVILKNTLRRETEWLRQGAKARTTKQQARIQRAGDLKEETEALTQRNQKRTARLDFQASDKNPKKLLEAKGVSKKLGGKVLFEGLNLLLTPGSRIGLLGRNGCGKSTLIRVLLGMEEPTTGSVFRSENLSLAYFDQARQKLDPNITVAKTLCPDGDFLSFRNQRVHIRSYLDRFLFTPGQAEMAVGKLSGGEQSRLLIARLMLTEANLLILDEPTNDLDMATLSVLEECLQDFPGAILLVTHDRYFLDQVTDQILAFPMATASGVLHSSQLLTFTGLEQWETWHKEETQRLKAQAKADAKDRNKTQPVPTAPIEVRASTPPETGAQKKRKLSYKEERELETMEATIHSAEARLQQIMEQSSQPENAQSAFRLKDLTEQMAKTQAEIDRLYARWSELESK